MGNEYHSLEEWTKEALIGEICRLRRELSDFLAPDDDLIAEFESCALDLVTGDKLTDFTEANAWQRSKEPWRRYKADTTESSWRLWGRI
jgi:hypothetical protein